MAKTARENKVSFGIQSFQLLDSDFSFEDKRVQGVLESGSGAFTGLLVKYDVETVNGWVFANGSVDIDKVIPLRRGHDTTQPTLGLGILMEQREGNEIWVAGSFHDTAAGRDAKAEVDRMIKFGDQELSVGGYSDKMRWQDRWSDTEKKAYDATRTFAIFDHYVPTEFSLVDSGAVRGASIRALNDLNAQRFRVRMKRDRLVLEDR